MKERRAATSVPSIETKFEEVNSGQFQSSLYATLKLAYKPFIGRMILAFILGFLGRLFLLANTNVIGHWVDQSLENSSTYILILTSLCVFGFIAIWIFRVLFSRLSALAISQIYDEVTLRTSRYPMSFFDKTPTGRIVTRFSSDYGNVFRLFGGPLAEFFAILFDLLAMIILALMADLSFIAVILMIGISNFVVYKFNQKRLRVFRRELSASRSPSIAHFSESAQGISLIRIFEKTKSFARRFQSLDEFFLSKKKQTYQGVVLYSLQMNALTAIILLVTGLASIFLVENGHLTVGSVGVIFTFIVLSGNTIQMFFDWLSQLEEAMIGVERLDQYLRLPLEQGAKIPLKSNFQGTHDAFFFKSKSKVLAKPVHFRSAAVQVEGLNFRYSDDQEFVLKDLSFELRPGEKLGIIGRTGSGKSSLIQAFFHLYSLHSGEIRINGYSAITKKEDESTLPLNLTQLNLTQSKATQNNLPVELEEFRKMMTYVPQESTLFRGSLSQNLDLENHANPEKMIEALRLVGLGDWFDSLPEKLLFQIEEKGKNLSLGERQLLCLARASLQDAPLIILDEATSSVDPQSEELLEIALTKIFEGKTQIIIAHRLSTLKNCDRILWIHRGKMMALDKAEIVMQKFQDSDLTNLEIQTGF